MERLVIGLAGPAGAGKSTVANHLVEKHGFTSVRFVGPLKAMARQLGLGDAEIEGGSKEIPCPLLTTENLVKLLGHGYAVFRAIGVNNVWVDDKPNDVLFGITPRDAVNTFYTVLSNAIERSGCDGATPRLVLQMLGTEWGRDQINQDFWIRLWQAKAKRHVRVVADDCRFPNEVDTIRSLGGVIIHIDRPDNALDVGEHKSESHRIVPDYTLRNDTGIDLLQFRTDLLIEAITTGPRRMPTNPLTTTPQQKAA